MSKKYRVRDEIGVPCIRCGQNTQVREHTHLTEKHLRQPYYFLKWFKCTNGKCKVTIFMKEEYKVWNNNKAANNIKLLEEDRENQQFIQKRL